MIAAIQETLHHVQSWETVFNFTRAYCLASSILRPDTKNPIKEALVLGGIDSISTAIFKSSFFPKNTVFSILYGLVGSKICHFAMRYFEEKDQVRDKSQNRDQDNEIAAYFWFDGLMGPPYSRLGKISEFISLLSLPILWPKNCLDNPSKYAPKKWLEFSPNFFLAKPIILIVTHIYFPKRYQISKDIVMDISWKGMACIVIYPIIKTLGLRFAEGFIGWIEEYSV